MNSGICLNARDFGARGDGTADDTKALQAALDAAGKQAGIVFVPDGTYLTSTLKFHPHTGIQGNATWGYQSVGGSILKLNDPNAKSLLDITGAVGAVVNGITLHGNDLGKDVHGIFMTKLENRREEEANKIERCHIERFTGDGIHLINAWCFSVRHCEVIFNKGNGLYVQGWDGFILDNWFSGNGGAGYLSDQPNASITITGNRIEWNRVGGIVILGGSHYNITGNYIDRSGHAGIRIQARGEKDSPSLCMTITGNIIYRSGKPEWTPDEKSSAHAIIEDSHGIVFTGNSMCIGQDDGHGKNSPLYGIVAKGLKNCVVANNVLHIGAIRELVADRGGHGEGVIIKDNVGSLYTDGDLAIWGSKLR